jgi:hypothetical protein
MACIICMAHPLAMATTQVRHAIHHEVCSFVPVAPREFTPLRMNWFVTTADTGERQLGMRWHKDG